MAPTHGPNQTGVTELGGHPEKLNTNSKTKENKVNLKINNEVDIFNDGYPPLEIKWINVVFLTMIHVGALAGLYALVTGQVMWRTALFGLSLSLLGGLGINAGVHRLWSHKSYKAKFPLRAFLAFCNTIAGQNSIHQWARDHRVHHKYSETLADPHNAKRGFFFSHVGWLMIKKHPAVGLKGKQIDISDLEADPVVMFQKRFYTPLMLSCTFILPSFIPCYFWGETTYNSMMISLLKYTLTLNFVWLVNSAAHYWGDRPYDKTINPRENPIVSVLTFGDGWHNYHHTFPWDYKAAELGTRDNLTKNFIEFMASIGQAYDMKTVPDHIVKQRMARTGNESHSLSHGTQDLSSFKPGPSAWGDEDIPESDATVTEILYPNKDN